MAKKKHLSKKKSNRDKQDPVFLDPPPEPPKNTDKVQLVKFGIYQALFLAILVLVGVVIYANTLQAPFVFDDQDAILNNPLIRMEEITAKNIIDAASGHGKSRPVSMLSFGFNYYFGQYNVLGYHLLNIFIHVINGILLFFFVKISLMLSNQKENTNRQLDPLTLTTLSFFSALLWLAHPVQTQSVTYIVQRMNSMGAMFYILALILYAKGRIAQQLSIQESDARSRHYYFWFVACFLAGLLALGSKENTAFLPVFIFLYEWYFFQDLDKNWFKRQLKYLTAIVILFGLVAGLYLGWDPMGKFNTLRDYVFREFTIGERLLTQTRVVLYYLSLIFYPNPSRLNLDHDFPISYSLFDPFTTFLSIIIIGGLIVLGLFLAKKQRLISFCIFWFLGNLVIESSVIPLAIIFEHRIYLPSMLVFLLIVILFHRTVKPAWLTTAIACTVVAVCSYWTYERNKIWQDDLRLWIDCSNKSPNNARPFLNIGHILSNREQYDEALPNFLKAIQINPVFVDAYYNLAILFDKRGESDKAIEHYRKALELEPDFAKANNNLGVVLLKQDLAKEASVYFQKALEKDPDFAAAHINYGLALSRQKKLNAAVVHFSKALQISSNLPRAQFQLGAALEKLGKSEQGVIHIKKALEIDPDYADALNNLGGKLLQQGKTQEALEHLTRALSIDPDLAEAHNNVGIIQIQQGNLDLAITHFQDALRIYPEFEMAKNNLQRALAIRDSMDSEIGDEQKEIDGRPDDPDFHFKSGNQYLRKGELHKAIIEFKKALVLEPEFLAAQNNLAMTYAADRQYNEALAAFKKLIELAPDNTGAYYNIAVLYALQNNVPDAIVWLKQAVDKGYRNWELIKTDKDLANIRNSEEYKQLVEGR